MNRTHVLAFCIGLLGPLGVASAGSFDTYHPDTYYRELGKDAWNDERYDEALDRFRMAARYADKTSQLSLATMYWKGQGVAADRSLAYAWADLAAERGYPEFVKVRERYWAQMTEAERARAIEVGTPLYEEYGDAVAMRRLASLLHRGLAQKTGTRTGSEVGAVGVAQFDAATRAALAMAVASKGGHLSLPILALGARTAAFVNGDTQNAYYNAYRWTPELYWIAQDALWMPDGEVTVGPLRTQKDGAR